jgi:hypothetical protein
MRTPVRIENDIHESATWRHERHPRHGSRPPSSAASRTTAIIAALVPAFRFSRDRRSMAVWEILEWVSFDGWRRSVRSPLRIRSLPNWRTQRTEAGCHATRAREFSAAKSPCGSSVPMRRTSPDFKRSSTASRRRPIRRYEKRGITRRIHPVFDSKGYGYAVPSYAARHFDCSRLSSPCRAPPRPYGGVGNGPRQSS